MVAVQASKQVVDKVLPNQNVTWADLFAISGAVRILSERGTDPQ